MLNVAFFGGLGHFSAVHLDAIAESHRVTAVFSAVATRGRARNLLRRVLRQRNDPLSRVARRLQLPHWSTDKHATRVAARLSALRPDVICVAGYPWLLPSGVWQHPPLGTLNCHASLLPRHRGILPLFWIYYRDDRRTGVTVHRVNEDADAGDIVCQDAYALPRGFNVDRLNSLNAERGGRMLAAALDALENRTADATPQREELATRAPSIRQGEPMVDFAWDVERVWHFLAGLCPRFIEPLRDHGGNPATYKSVIGYERDRHLRTPGTVEPGSFGWKLYCDGGAVRLGRNTESPEKRAELHA